jgi:sugar lactone lactonase YvrE
MSTRRGFLELGGVMGGAFLVGSCAHGRLSTAPVSAGRVTLVAGGPDDGSQRALTGAGMNEPFGVAIDRHGHLFIAEERGNRVRRVDPAGKIETYAGTGVKGDGGDGGPANQAQLNNPHHVAFAPGNKDDLIIADTVNARVRRVAAATGVITTIAGTAKGFGGDGGPALQAQFAHVFCVAFDRQGQTMYIADTGNRRVRAVDLRTGVTSTVAGNGEKAHPTDGAVATEAPLFDPRAVDIDSQGNLYVLERNGHALRVVDKAGKIRTVAGTGEKGFTGDGGDARAATFNGPKFVYVDAADDVLIVDTENHCIRKYLPREGKLVRLAGTGEKGDAGLGGPPDQLQMNRPHGVYEDSKGALWISDSSNHRVVRVDRA